MAVPDELTRSRRRKPDAELLGLDLFWNADQHGCFLFYKYSIRTEVIFREQDDTVLTCKGIFGIIRR
jgi:hypothetical protein